ncbi:M14 family metallopeptidase [Nocardia wallacei]|uniref:M14 family metallopeptidase n=1 Tax=Nocardia wallacei TaxID=480035 RepID=UPI0024581776|nr:M14 family metallocarboxypeptidase [Nocardia wallacei]
MPKFVGRFTRCVVTVSTCAALSSTAGVGAAAADSYDDAYHPYAETVARLATVVARNPGLMHLGSIGRSVQGRDIPALTIGELGGGAPRLLITCGQHAREWISVAVCMGLANRYADGYSTDPAIKRLIDTHPIDIVPLVNPDGYEYTFTPDDPTDPDHRMWRKNRSGPNRSGPCRGVDLNRNFDYNWSEAGASDDPCDENYAGPSAFSEPETRALRGFIGPRNFGAAIDFHSFHQVVAYPEGRSSVPAPDREQLAAVADLVADAMSRSHGTRFRSGSAPEVLYPVGGGLPDWLYGTKGIPALTVELRDTGRYGFELPPDQIRPSIDEALDGTNALLAEL